MSRPIELRRSWRPRGFGDPLQSRPTHRYRDRKPIEPRQTCLGSAGTRTPGFFLVLERRMLAPRARTAFILAMIWCAALFGFARSNIYALAISLLFIAGFVELAFNSMAQALVQMNAPNEIRGRVIGVFSMSAMGMRTFSGLSVGILGASVGIHNSLGFSAAVLFVIIAVMFAARYGRGHRKEGQ
jgi:MFS family permease